MFDSIYEESSSKDTPYVADIPVEVILVNEDDDTLNNEDGDTLTILT